VTKIKLFLSHASEDQESFVRPLADALSEAGFDVWYSEYELKLGDKLLEKINEGLHTCDYGVVVFSRSFFAKKWPMAELSGLFQLETEERKLILPVWKDIDEDDVRRTLPILADRFAIKASLGIVKVVSEIKYSVGLVGRTREISPPTWLRKLKQMDASLSHRKKVEAYGGTEEGTEAAAASARRVIEQAKRRVDELAELSAVKMTVRKDKSGSDSVTISGPRGLALGFHFSQLYSNAIDECSLSVVVSRLQSFTLDTNSYVVERTDFSATFDAGMQPAWKSDDHPILGEQEVLDFGFERFAEYMEEELDESQN